MEVKRQPMGHHHNLIRSKHNEDTKKYSKQEIRTARNKARHIAKAKKLKEAADVRKAANKFSHDESSY